MRVAKCRPFAKSLKKKRGYWSLLQNGACVHHVMVSKINGSHFGFPPSSIHKMTGLGGKMTYSHRPHFVLLSHSAQNTFLVFRSLLLWISGLQQLLPDPVVCVDSCASTNNTSGETFSTFQPPHQVKQVQRFSFDYLGTFQDQQPGKRRYQPTTRRNPSTLTSNPSCRDEGPRKLAISKSSVETSVPCFPRRFSTGGPATNTFQANEQVLRGLQKQPLQEEPRKEQPEKQEAQCPPPGLQQESEGLASGGSFEAEVEKSQQCVKTEALSLLRTPRISLEDEEYLYRYPSPIYTPEFAWMLGPELQSEGMEPVHSVQNAGQDRPGGVDHDGE